jgi:hypothetical protein
METLDGILNGREPTLIKLDVEGFEPEVLRGASRALNSGSLLAVETEDVSPETRASMDKVSLARRFYDPTRRQLADSPMWKASNALFVRAEPDVRRRIASG